MRIVIEYCGSGDYRPHAFRAEAELKGAYPDSTIVRVESSGEIFEVKCDGMLVYSKQQVPGDRFPITGELTKLLGNKERARELEKERAKQGIED
ncbi:MAG TPA: Rdx family protein [Syntrophorhabdaceae bacterium]|jgi:selT/selW/selH-like putative selenoprotein